MEKEMINQLIDTAIHQLKYSYTPYSNFKVGAALLAKNGQVYTGCNIENASFTPTVCAERVAIFKAVSEGEREFSKIAVAGGKNGEISSVCPPCGVCRQVLSEFCGPDFEVLFVLGNGNCETHTLGELLPHSFKV